MQKNNRKNLIISDDIKKFIIKNKMIVGIFGPYGVDNVDFALYLSKLFGNSPIINYDLNHYYKELDVGFRKPKIDKKSKSKLEMYSILEPIEKFDIAKFQVRTRKLIDSYLKNNKIPILVGSTGKEFQYLVKDFDHTETFRKNYDLLREQYLQLSIEELFDMLPVYIRIVNWEVYESNKDKIIDKLIRIKLDSKTYIKGDEYYYNPILIGLKPSNENLKSKLEEIIYDFFEVDVKNEVDRCEYINEVLRLKENYPSSERLENVSYVSDILKHLKHNISVEETKTILLKGMLKLVHKQSEWVKENLINTYWYQINAFNQVSTYNEIVVDLIDNFEEQQQNSK